jgi:hypothetical protein
MATERSFLFVPGDRTERFAKALATRADRVIIDLEDAVLPTAKILARDRLVKWLDGDGARDLMVRVNAVDHHEMQVGPVVQKLGPFRHFRPAWPAGHAPEVHDKVLVAWALRISCQEPRPKVCVLPQWRRVCCIHRDVGVPICLFRALAAKTPRRKTHGWPRSSAS